MTFLLFAGMIYDYDFEAQSTKRIKSFYSYAQKSYTTVYTPGVESWIERDVQKKLGMVKVISWKKLYNL